MRDADRDRETGRDRPAWAETPLAPSLRDRDIRREARQGAAVPVEPRLWEPVLTYGALAALGTLLAVAFIPREFPSWELISAYAAVTAVTWYVSLRHTMSLALSSWLGAWGIILTSWIAWARIAGPWHAKVFAGLLLPVLVMAPLGASVISRHRDRAIRAAGTGGDSASARECRYWEGLLQRLSVAGVTVRDVIAVEGGRQVHCRLGKITQDRRPATIEAVREITGVLAQHRRLLKGAVYLEEEPAGGSAADFIIHVREAAGPRGARYLPQGNHLLTITREFGLGVLDTGREFRLKLREVVVFIAGLRGAGKSTLLNVFIAQLARCTDALIFMIDLKGGQESMAWILPWLQGLTGRPVIDWLATTREEAGIMLDALMRAGQARASSGRHGRKLRPSPDHPAIIVICDETAVMTGHFIREDGISNTKLATRLLQVAETFRSVGIDPVIAAVRAVVDTTGNSGIKAMSEVRIGMRVATMEEGRQIFPDDLAAARQLARLRDKGMGIPKVGAQLFPPVHFYNITDGNPDDDGNPTEDLITPVAVFAGNHRPGPEQLIRDAMGEAYENRWTRPQIRALLDTWREQAGVPAPQPARVTSAERGVPADEQAQFREIARLEFGEDPDSRPEDGQPLHPVHRRMRQLLIERGGQGYRGGMLWSMLLNEGLAVSRQHMYKWLAADEKKGYVFRTGAPRSRWVWRLRPGDEFDIPGMS